MKRNRNSSNGEVREVGEGWGRHLRESVQGEGERYWATSGIEENEVGDGRGRGASHGAEGGVAITDAVAVALCGEVTLRRAR